MTNRSPDLRVVFEIQMMVPSLQLRCYLHFKVKIILKGILNAKYVFIIPELLLFFCGKQYEKFQFRCRAALFKFLEYFTFTTKRKGKEVVWKIKFLPDM